MSNLINNFKAQFYQANLVQKLIYINVGIFIITYFFGGTLSFLFNSDFNFMYRFFALPAEIEEVVFKPWTFITYGFMHGGFIHLLFNMIFLYYIGNLFLDYFIPKRLLNVYILGTLFGGLLYFLSYNFFPGLNPYKSTLVGASSAIMAIVVGIATHMPHFEIKLRFVGFVKLWIIAAIYVVWDLLSISKGNAGGHIAHLGGALFGFLYINSNSSIEIPFKEVFKRKSPLKTAYKAKKKKQTVNQSSNQDKIDAILDKISKSGYDSLSKSEKDFLFQQGKK